MGMRENMVYYYTPQEIHEQANKLYGRPIRLGGRVVRHSIQKEPSHLILRFQLGDEKAKIPVLYKGTIPDTFRAEGDGIVEGELRKDGTFYATTLLAKCPSKYERRDLYKEEGLKKT